jgi:hypothetical protein
MVPTPSKGEQMNDTIIDLNNAGINRSHHKLDIGYGKEQEIRLYEWNGQKGLSVGTATSCVVPLSRQEYYQKGKKEDMDKRRGETAEIGIAAHKIMEADGRGEEVSVPDGMSEWHAEWDKAKKNFDITAEYSEVKVFSQTYNYGGTIDRIGNFNGTRCVMDLKSGHYSHIDLWKTEAYRQAYIEMTGDHEVGLVVLYIPRPDLAARGKTPRHYSVQHHNSCFLAFLSAMYNFKMLYYKELPKMGFTGDQIFQHDPIVFAKMLGG